MIKKLHVVIVYIRKKVSSPGKGDCGIEKLTTLAEMEK